MSRHMILLTAILIPVACLPRPPEFAPEDVTERFSSGASVVDVAGAAVAVLRAMEWRVQIDYVTDSLSAVSGEYIKSLPTSLSGGKYYFSRQVSYSAGPVGWGWVSTTTLQVMATRAGGLTQVTIVPAKRGSEGPLPLGSQEVRMTRRLTEHLQKELRSRSS